VLLMPGVFSFLIVLHTRGWLRATVLLFVFALPLIALYRGQQCQMQAPEAAVDPCFANNLLAGLGLMLGVSALIGATGAAILRLRRHPHLFTMSFVSP